MSEDDWDKVLKWHFALAGIQTGIDSLELKPGVSIARLKTLPTRNDLTVNLKSSLVAGVMQHYGGEDIVEHELIIDAELADDPGPVPEQAEHVLAGLRIRTEAEIFCPAVCDRSWSDLRHADPYSCLADLMEPAMYSHAFDTPTTITQDDPDWVRENLPTLSQLTEDDRFTTALDALSTYLHAANYRMMAAQLWAGIEAIFEAEYETSYSMSLWAALLLEKRGANTCSDRRKVIRKLCNERSTAVHGGRISEDKLRTHVFQARRLLAQLLARIIERGAMPSRDDFHDLTTMPDDFQKRTLEAFEQETND